MQSFMAAGEAFKAIDAPIHSVIVSYGEEGKQIINDLCAVNNDFNAKSFYTLLKKAQKYSVNVFPHVWKQLVEDGAVIEIQGEGIFYLKEQYYNNEFGLSVKPIEKMKFNGC